MKKWPIKTSGNFEDCCKGIHKAYLARENRENNEINICENEENKDW